MAGNQPFGNDAKEECSNYSSALFPFSWFCRPGLDLSKLTAQHLVSQSKVDNTKLPNVCVAFNMLLRFSLFLSFSLLSFFSFDNVGAVLLRPTSAPGSTELARQALIVNDEVFRLSRLCLRTRFT